MASRRVKFVAGSAGVEIDSAMADIVERVVRGMAPAVTGALEEAVDRIATNARDKWPVNRRRFNKRKTRSKDSIESLIRVPSLDRVEGVVQADLAHSDYTYFVKSNQVKTGNGHAWTELVRKPGQEVQEELAERLGDELRRLAEGTK